MKTVLFADPGVRIDPVYTQAVQKTMAERWELFPVPLNRENAEAHAEILRDAEIGFATWGMPTFSEEQIRKWMPKLRAVFYAAGSVQYFARPFLRAGVRVFSAWAANAVPVVEFAVSQILLANKGTYQALRAMREGGYSAAKLAASAFPGNYGVKVGLLGLGMIGSQVAQELKRHEIEVWGYDPFCSGQKAAALQVELHTLEEIFASCQTISNHIANLPATQNLLHYEHFSRMLPNAVFINTGRAQQTVEADLCRALQEEPGRALVADVTYPEPPLESNPLYTLPNVFLTPHIAGSTGNEMERQAKYMLEECDRFLSGDALRWEVTEKMLETMA